MMVEVLAAMGDELAFYQDRVARETQFGSASQRRSVCSRAAPVSAVRLSGANPISKRSSAALIWSR